MAYPQGSTVTAPKPSKTGIIWAIVIFVVTAIVGIVMIAISIGTIAGAINDLQEVDAGQTKELTLTPGDQYVFVGARSEAALADVEVIIEDPSGDRLRPTSSGSTYDANNNGEVFKSIGYIDVPTTGTYTVSVDGPSGSSVRIGEIPLGRFLALLFGGIAIGAIGFVVALVILIVALVRRGRVKRAARAAAGPPPGYPTPGGYGAAGTYGAPPGYAPPARSAPAPAPPAYAPPPASPPPPAPPASAPPAPAPATDGPPPPPPPPGPANPA